MSGWNPGPVFRACRACVLYLSDPLTITETLMPNIEFSLEELEVMREVLQHAASEVDMEILRTDHNEFKQMLKRRKALLEQALRRLAVETAPA